MKHVTLSDCEFDLNKREIISIATDDNKTWRVVCRSGFQFDTTDQTLINDLLS